MNTQQLYNYESTDFISEDVLQKALYLHEPAIHER